MHRILVDEKNSISDGRLLHALDYCMLLPGPRRRSSLLCTSVGCIGQRWHRGGRPVGVFAIMGLSYIYAAYGNVGLVEALFFGLKAAVLAIVTQAVVRVRKRALPIQS